MEKIKNKYYEDIYRIFEGEYLNGEKSGKGKEYYLDRMVNQDLKVNI